MSTELQIRPDQTSFDDKQRAALTALGVQNAPPADIALFFHQAARTGLDPFARQIYLINRGGKNTIQVGIDGFRVIRDRKGNYQGHTEEWCGPDGQWKDVWLDSKPPAAARVSVYVKGYVQPVVGIALWSEYAQIGRDGKPQALWGSKPALMLAKCAEALALRKAYPQDLSGLYTTDELPEAEQDEDGVYVTTQMRSAAPQRRPEPKRAPQPQRQAVTVSPDEARDKAAVAEQWASRIADADTRDALTALHAEAAQKPLILDYPIAGRTLEQVFRGRLVELQNAPMEAEPEPVEPELFEDETPF